ncbi:MAG: DUF4091 domain-containing protein [Clostridia bacterium]|nr:DUF4091 domain-containing protein [Clostridia bacterium]
MMPYQIFSENEWIYPDTVLTEANAAVLHSPRGADVCFQVLTDHLLREESFSLDVTGLDGISAEPYQLMGAYVDENSHAKSLTTLDYDSVKHFVTRKAPFTVYDMTRPLDTGRLALDFASDRAAFYIRLNVPANAVPGQYNGAVTLHIGEETLVLPVSLKVYGTVVPALPDASFHQINWIYYDKLAAHHNVEIMTPAYRDVLLAYFANQQDMRNDYLMIPSGVPVRDTDGRVVDFDFTHAAYVGNLALEYGFRYVLGGFVARFDAWDDPDHMLLWDRSVGVSTIEGYRQLKIYFTRAWECEVQNGWQENYMQCLVDEPQFPNSLTYRALSGICRSRMPGVKINDPVETTEIAGALDVWVVKQAVYEKYLDDYRRLQDMGEEMWLYTCGFPAGKTMNRVMDLPLTVSRLPMWMCVLYDCPGFLHWGYHCHNEERERSTCYRAGGTARYPAGNAHVVYPGDGRPWYSVRGHLQRAGAVDAELFHMLDPDCAKALIRQVCTSFDDYDPAAGALEDVRRQVLEILG